jgi:ABC-2 type transport system ATP-binding protein
VGAAPTLTLIAAAGFTAFCVVDLIRRTEVRYFPKWIWALVIFVSIPIGGIIYLGAGRGRAETVDVGEAFPSIRRGSARPGGPIEVEHLTKRFGPTAAVDDLTFRVQPGRVTGFLGPNGAGKTTTMRMILGLVGATGGRATVHGHPYQELAQPLREVGALLDAGAAHAARSARLHVLSVAQSNGIDRKRVDDVLELTGLASVADRRVREFSLGMKQRLGIAIALLGDPPVLLFDEPVNGLDPEGVHWIRELFRSLAAEGRTVFVSSHLMSEMAVTADHLVIIGRGKLLADTGTDAFMEANARKDVLVRSPRAAELNELLVRAGATVAADGSDGVAVTGMGAAQIGELAAARQIPLHELTPRHASLEEAYLDLTAASVEYRAGAS